MFPDNRAPLRLQLLVSVKLITKQRRQFVISRRFGIVQYAVWNTNANLQQSSHTEYETYEAHVNEIREAIMSVILSEVSRIGITSRGLLC